jgi:predicted TPR repeat methyltransferase
LNEETANNHAIFNSAFVVNRKRILIERFIPPGPRVLDVGIDTGRTTGFLAPQAARYVGFDCAPAMIERARARSPAADLRVADRSSEPKGVEV